MQAFTKESGKPLRGGNLEKGRKRANWPPGDARLKAQTTSELILKKAFPYQRRHPS